MVNRLKLKNLTYFRLTDILPLERIRMMFKPLFYAKNYTEFEDICSTVELGYRFKDNGENLKEFINNSLHFVFITDSIEISSLHPISCESCKNYWKPWSSKLFFETQEHTLNTMVERMFGPDNTVDTMCLAKSYFAYLLKMTHKNNPLDNIFNTFRCEHCHRSADTIFFEYFQDVLDDIADKYTLIGDDAFYPINYYEILMINAIINMNTTE